jgi:Spy/CpxP family protein refolding chaperone
MKTIILAAAFLLLETGHVFAQPGSDPGVWEKMNLSEDQRSELKQIRSDTRKQMIDLRANLQKKRVDMRSMMDSDTPDRVAFEKLSREMADIRLQQKMLLFDTDQSIMKNLNPEQQKLWKEMRQRRLHSLGDGRHDRGGLRDRGDMRDRGKGRPSRLR